MVEIEAEAGFIPLKRVEVVRSVRLLASLVKRRLSYVQKALLVELRRTLKVSEAFWAHANLLCDVALDAPILRILLQPRESFVRHAQLLSLLSLPTGVVDLRDVGHLPIVVANRGVGLFKHRNLVFILHNHMGLK